MESTKFTEVGYHGRNVDQIIRDLADASMQLTRRVWTEKLRSQAAAMVEDKILDLLAGPAAKKSSEKSEKEESGASRGRESFRDMLRQGILDDQTVEVNVPVGDKPGSDMPLSGGDPSNPTFVAMSDLYQKLSGSGSKKQPTERKKLTIPEARKAIEEVELEKLLENVDIKKLAIEAVEQSGIVFIDEMYDETSYDPISQFAHQQEFYLTLMFLRSSNFAFLNWIISTVTRFVPLEKGRHIVQLMRRLKVSNATCCHWSKEQPSKPTMATLILITFYLLLQGRSMQWNPAICCQNSRVVFPSVSN